MILARKNTVVEGKAEVVDGQAVQSRMTRVRRRAGPSIQDAEQGWADPRHRRHARARPCWRDCCRLGQVEQLLPFRLIQPQGLGQGLQYRVRRPGEVTPLEPGVEVEAHPGE
jgi:hypothetical protein